MSNSVSPREIHARHPAIDGHADSIWRYLADPEGFFGGARLGHLDSRRLRETGQNVQVMAVYTPPEHADLAALQYALDFLHAIEAVLDSPANAALQPPFSRILSPADLRRACEPGSFGFLLFIEGASPLRGNMKNLDLFHRLGVRGITITHNHDNEAAKGCFAEGSAGPYLRAGCRRDGSLRHGDRPRPLNEDVFWDTSRWRRGHRLTRAGA
jgi:membrane dipeptidase